MTVGSHTSARHHSIPYSKHISVCKMVQGLGFLSKKSWHTKNIANQERVWMAEEREKVEKAKTAELAKQIQQEREEDELRRVTGTDKALDRGIAWLYDGHKKDSETAKEDAAKQAEEYLLGKPIAAASGKAVGHFETTAEAHEGVNAVVPAVAAKDESTARHIDQYHQNTQHTQDTSDSVACRNEAFRIRYEDPMYAVSLQSVRQEKAEEHRKNLYERAGIAVQTIQSGTDKSRTDPRPNKKDKKEKKHDKKRRKQYDGSDSEVDHRSRSHSRHYKKRKHRTRSRSRSVETTRSRRRTEQRTRSQSFDESSFESRTAHRRRRSKTISEPRRRHSRSWSKSPNNRSTRREQKSKETDRDEFGRSRKYDTRYTDPINDAPKQKIDGYGLQGSSETYQIRPTCATLGPDPELLRAKRASREAERLQRMEQTSSRRYRTTSEREQARLEMERNAAIRVRGHDALINQPYPDDTETCSGRNGSFLRDATVKAHGLGESERTLTDRLRERRHRNQGLSDSFL